MENCSWDDSQHRRWYEVTMRINTFMSQPYLSQTAVTKIKQPYGTLKYETWILCIKERLSTMDLSYEQVEKNLRPFTGSFICKPLLSDTQMWKPLLGSATLATILNFMIIATFLLICLCIKKRKKHMKHENDRRIKQATKKKIKSYKQRYNKQTENSDTKFGDIHGII